jgi:2-methylcitrate dehydratase PrpD
VADLFADRREDDEEVRALSTRIRVEADDGELAARFPDAYATELVVRLGDGRELRKRNDMARGYPETPLTADEIEAKFRGLVGGVARAGRVQALHRTLEALPSSANIAELADALRDIRRQD